MVAEVTRLITDITSCDVYRTVAKTELTAARENSYLFAFLILLAPSRNVLNIRGRSLYQGDAHRRTRCEQSRNNQSIFDAMHIVISFFIPQKYLS